MLELSEEMKRLYMKTAQVLKGSERRQFMAGIVRWLGTGGQSYAARTFHWGRNTIRKGMQELESGSPIPDNFSGRGRQKAEEKLPHLLQDIQAIVDGQSQTDPSFRTTRLYTRLSAAAVHQQLIQSKGYDAAELPTAETIRVKLKALGYTLRAVQKSRPPKNS